MKREILTYPLERSQVKEELAFFVEHFSHFGFETCEVLFGSAWGIDYYPTAEWHYVKLRLVDLVMEVERVEGGEWGPLGSNDLFVRFPSLAVDFHFCNDSDIHIYFEEPNDVTEFFYLRWKARQFSPAEWLKPAEGPATERIRFN
jgi:hypothetical protein